MSYDAAGNRLTQEDAVSGDTTTFSYDAANQLLTAEDTSGTTTYTYDQAGNRLTMEEPSGEVTTNTWDPENRLVKVEHDDGTEVEYKYNGDGLRVEKVVDGTDTTKYIFDGNNVLQETDDAGTVEADFTYVPGQYGRVISQHRDLNSSFYHFDGIKNVCKLTDDTEVVSDEYTFDAFGNEVSSSGSTANSQRYKGRLLAYHQDPEAAPQPQYALHHRNYDPSTGVFTSRDPAEDDSNLYRYVKNNPINRADPSGLQQGEVKDPDTLLGGLTERQRQRLQWHFEMREQLLSDGYPEAAQEMTETIKILAAEMSGKHPEHDLFAKMNQRLANPTGPTKVVDTAVRGWESTMQFAADVTTIASGEGYVEVDYLIEVDGRLIRPRIISPRESQAWDEHRDRNEMFAIEGLTAGAARGLSLLKGVRLPHRSRAGLSTDVGNFDDAGRFTYNSLDDVPAPNRGLADLPYPTRHNQGFVRVSELLDEGNIKRLHPINPDQMHGTARAGHGGVRNLSNEDLMKFGGPQGTDPITVNRVHTLTDDPLIPGSRLEIQAGHHRLEEIRRRVQNGTLSPDTIIEVVQPR